MTVLFLCHYFCSSLSASSFFAKIAHILFAILLAFFVNIPEANLSTASNTYYRVVAGSYTNRTNADKLVSDLKSKGYLAFIDIYKK